AGQVFLRGVVASEEVAREIEQTAWSVPGVSRVVTQFQVRPRRVEAPTPEVPPPPPQPVVTPSPDARLSAPPAPGFVQPRGQPENRRVAALDPHRLTDRVVGSLRRRPAVAEFSIKVRSTDDVVTLSGKVPSAYEAMIAYRAAQQTP